MTPSRPVPPTGGGIPRPVVSDETLCGFGTEEQGYPAIVVRDDDGELVCSFECFNFAEVDIYGPITKRKKVVSRSVDLRFFSKGADGRTVASSEVRISITGGPKLVVNFVDPKATEVTVRVQQKRARMMDLLDTMTDGRMDKMETLYERAAAACGVVTLLFSEEIDDENELDRMLAYLNHDPLPPPPA